MAIHTQLLEREAARLLARIIPDLHLHEAGGKLFLAFEAPPDLLDRLCVWGSEGEDIEDDAPMEPDARDSPLVLSFHPTAPVPSICSSL